MTETVVYVRASRAAVRQALAKIPDAARNRGAIADAMMTRCGIALLRRIREAFIVKARGGTDEAGDKWVPLKRETIAYSRRHPGMPKAHDRADFPPSWMLTRTARVNAIVDRWRITGKVGRKTVSTEAEARRAAVAKIGVSARPETNALGRWWQLYRQGLAMYHGNKGAAARFAWWKIKQEGANTIIGVFGDAQVDILRSTGLLFNSLSPGVASGDQVFRLGNGEVIVGTNRKHASAHHEGRGHVPQRRLWPEPRRWPSSWWLDILEQARQGLVDITLYLVRGS